jgi:hypothetical protein
MRRAGACSLTAAALLLGLGGLGGCASNLTNPRVPPPGSEAFQDGYLSGCRSGFSEARREGYQTGYVRDDRNYVSDPDYHRGWDQGERACYEEEMRNPSLKFIKG